jgi:hypothetical protein
MLRIVSQAIAPDNGDRYRRAVAEVHAALERAIAVTVPADASFADRERAVLAAANDACRLALKTALQATAEAQAEQVRVDGVLYERHHEGTVVYHSLCGPLEVRRATYREVGERNGPTVVPLELATGLIEGATPALAYRVALGYAQGPGRHAEEQMHADHRRPPSRSTLERLGKAIGIQTHRVAPRIEAALRPEETAPEGTQAIVVGLDRTTVPMEEPRPAGAAPTTRRKARTTPYVRTPPDPVDVQYRMAYVGTVSLVDRTAEALVTRRYAIAATEDPTGLTARLMADITRARAQAPRLPVAIVQDAAPELWTLLRTALTTETRLRRWHEAIDRYHLNERLAEILRLVESDERRRHQQLRRWNTALDTDDRAIDRIATWIAQRLPEHDGEALATLEKHWTYLVNNNDRMRYATLRRIGLPGGSGATEGACKSVVTMRAKGSGQRWHADGVTAALSLRAIYLSERLPTLWSHFAADYSADVQAAA